MRPLGGEARCEGGLESFRRHTSIRSSMAAATAAVAGAGTEMGKQWRSYRSRPGGWQKGGCLFTPGFLFCYALALVLLVYILNGLVWKGVGP